MCSLHNCRRLRSYELADYEHQQPNVIWYSYRPWSAQGFGSPFCANGMRMRLEAFGVDCGLSGHVLGQSLCRRVGNRDETAENRTPESGLRSGTNGPRLIGTVTHTPDKNGFESQIEVKTQKRGERDRPPFATLQHAALRSGSLQNNSGRSNETSTPIFF